MSFVESEASNMYLFSVSCESTTITFTATGEPVHSEKYTFSEVHHTPTVVPICFIPVAWCHANDGKHDASVSPAVGLRAVNKRFEGSCCTLKKPATRRKTWPARQKLRCGGTTSTRMWCWTDNHKTGSAVPQRLHSLWNNKLSQWSLLLCVFHGLRWNDGIVHGSWRCAGKRQWFYWRHRDRHNWVGNANMLPTLKTTTQRKQRKQGDSLDPKRPHKASYAHTTPTLTNPFTYDPDQHLCRCSWSELSCWRFCHRFEMLLRAVPAVPKNLWTCSGLFSVVFVVLVGFFCGIRWFLVYWHERWGARTLPAATWRVSATNPQQHRHTDNAAKRL